MILNTCMLRYCFYYSAGPSPLLTQAGLLGTSFTIPMHPSLPSAYAGLYASTPHSCSSYGRMLPPSLASENWVAVDKQVKTHKYKHINIYIYIYICVCLCNQPLKGYTRIYVGNTDTHLRIISVYTHTHWMHIVHIYV